MTRGVFCVIEGVDGSGKSGAIARISRELQGDGYDLVTTREPGGTDAGLELRKLLLAKDAFDWTPTSELLLMNAARAQHVERVIHPAVSTGRFVLCDRFVGSTLAYQGGGRSIPLETILSLHRLSTGDLWPDLTIILDVDPRLALARSRTRLAAGAVDEGRFESLDLAFHDRVRQSFLEQANGNPGRSAVLDASGDIETVQLSVLSAIRKFLKDRMIA